METETVAETIIIITIGIIGMAVATVAAGIIIIIIIIIKIMTTKTIKMVPQQLLPYQEEKVAVKDASLSSTSAEWNDLSNGVRPVFISFFVIKLRPTMCKKNNNKKKSRW